MCAVSFRVGLILMYELGSALWETSVWEWDLGYAWRSMGLLVRFDVYGLALMFAVTLIILARTAWLYHSFAAKSDEAAQSSLNQLICVLSRQRLWLRSFASTAPALGLLGTCIGIPAATYAWGDTNNPIRRYAEQFGVSLMTTAMGLAIGVIGQLADRYVRGRIAQLTSKSTYPQTPMSHRQRRSRRFPLQSRFSQLPTFPIMAAPWLVLLAAWFMPSYVSKGLLIHLRPLTALAAEATPSITIAVTQDVEGRTIFFVNRKPIPTEALKDVLRSESAISKAAVYVQAEDDVRWADVVDAIDAAQSVNRNVVLLTVPPELKLPHAQHPSKLRR